VHVVGELKKYPIAQPAQYVELRHVVHLDIAPQLRQVPEVVLDR
jgi:hypothetical protein